MEREGDSKWMPSAGIGQQPPGYYSSPVAGSHPHWSDHSLPSGPNACFNQGIYPQPVTHTPSTPAVTVTQPVIVTNDSHGQSPDTSCALVMSTLSTILCGFWCGAVAIMLAWKARMQILDKKFEHANHTLKMVWLFVFLACLFGISIWVIFGIYLYYIYGYMYY